MPKIKSLNGYEITDEYARAQIENINEILDSLSVGPDELATETWTFTLEDGSTVTKAVYVG